MTIHDSLLEVEVVYALPDKQVMKRFNITVGTTAGVAIEQSGILEMFPEIDLTKNRYGIFGKLIKYETVLHQRDRVEIYRPLVIDPKDARRKRAAI
jgi:uncharacterized protein